MTLNIIGARLGRLSPLLAIAFFVLAGIISKLNWGRVGGPLIATANLAGYRVLY